MVIIFSTLASISFSLVFLAIFWYFIEINFVTDSPRIDFIESLILGLLTMTGMFLVSTLFFYCLNIFT